MAAGVIRNQNEFHHLSAFQYQFCIPPFQQELDFQETSEEEEEEDEEEEYEAEESARDNVLLLEDLKVLDPSSRVCEPAIKLLRFAEIISSDIQRYFGKKSKEDDPDSCNIYEERFSAGKSGRELYYADLVQIAQLGDQDGGDHYVTLTPPKDVDYQVLKSMCDRDSFNKLGPLAELFEYGLYKYFRQRAAEGKTDTKQKLSKKYAHVIPMYKRKLPPSFWKEPSLNSSCVLHTHGPDFSDLLANWTSEASHELHIGVISDVSRETSRNSLGTEHYQTG
ncbi:protein PERCC1 [Protopterus annectens]|uniref:protein PERCC1 n=1 Tax=Protopterus annectens TaxID=7888 RepID=UPI001CF95185|nr:protein PERCC1 [Protopterus annectens]